MSSTYYELMKQTEYYRELTNLMTKLCDTDNILFPLIYKNYVNKIDPNIDEIKKLHINNVEFFRSIIL